MLYNNCKYIANQEGTVKYIELVANAKINLFLDVESKRDDGYHNIVSLMQSVDLHDNVTIFYEPSVQKKIEIKTDDPRIPDDERNIAYKAADRLVDSGHIRIEIQKRIPSPAGLAGGSADAAAVIYGLCKLGVVDKSDKEIFGIAARIGADVPFCLVGGTKKITGIGDIIEDVTSLPELNLVIAVSGEGVSTPSAYAMLDERYDNFKAHKVTDLDFESFSTNNIYNVFEQVILPRREQAKNLKAEMISLGALTSFMSGSGPAIVGIFDSSEKANSAADELTYNGISAFACKTVKQGIEEK